MSHAVVKKTVHAPVDAVWETLSQFGGIEEYVPAIVSCVLEGSGLGARRTLVFGDGATVLEELVALDDRQRTLSYAILDSPLPFDDYLATIRVRETDAHHCEIEWSSTFQPEGAPEPDIVEMVQDIYNSAIRGLEEMHGS